MGKKKVDDLAKISGGIRIDVNTNIKAKSMGFEDRTEGTHSTHIVDREKKRVDKLDIDIL